MWLQLLTLQLPLSCCAAAMCLDDAVPPSKRRNLANAEGRGQGKRHRHESDMPRPSLCILCYPLFLGLERI